MNPSNLMHEPILCITGPTGSGKSQLAIRLAEQTPCCIISVDAVKIYRGLDIGAAKPDLAIRQRIPHALIDIIDPEETYGVARFYKDVMQAIEQAYALQQRPLLVGGTMMYIHILRQGLLALPESTAPIKMQVQAELAEYGIAWLYQKLLEHDPATAQQLKPTDTQRICRAWEVYQQTGCAMTELQKAAPAYPALPLQLFALCPDPAELRHHIGKRFERMLECGLIAEVEQLRRKRPLLRATTASMRTVGYKQVWQYLDGTIDYATMKTQATTATCQLAKKQRTWMRKWSDLIVLTHDPLATLLRYCT